MSTFIDSLKKSLAPYYTYIIVLLVSIVFIIVSYLVIQKYKQKNLIRSRIELRELFERRKKTEGVFILSINSLEKQLNELKTRIEELDLRSSMGQSVFLDYSNKKIEYLELKEGLLRLKTDFLTGWIDFLEQVNGYKSS